MTIFLVEPLSYKELTVHIYSIIHDYSVYILRAFFVHVCIIFRL